MKSGWYDFYCCNECDKEFAVLNLYNDESYLNCPYCDGFVNGSSDFEGQHMIEFKE